MYIALVCAELLASLRQAIARKCETHPRLSIMAATVVGLVLLAVGWTTVSALLLPVRRNRYGTVSGRVTATTGGPITNAIVVFMNEAAGVGASARIDAGGHYKAYGVQPGRYNVAVQPVVEFAGVELQKEAAEAARSRLEASVPLKFQETQNSGLEAELKGGRNRFDIDLSSRR